MKKALVAFLRGQKTMLWRDALRAAIGALLGIAFTGLAARFLTTGTFSLVPLLIAPIGASAVLVFAIPASPLAQPRAVIGGNVIAAVVGVGCALFIPAQGIAAPAAVALAILAMGVLGCLHPPGGAVALSAILLGMSDGSAGFAYIGTVAFASVLIVGAAVIYARFTRASYPQSAPVPKVHATKDPAPSERVGFTLADLDAALAEYGKLLDVSREDLDALFRQVELKAHRRLHAQIQCADIMSRDVIAVERMQSAVSALDVLWKHDLRVVPVVDAGGRVVGIVRRAELVSAGALPVATVLDPKVHKVGPATPIENLLPLLSQGGAHEVMVVDENDVLVGVVTQTDLLAVLYRAHIVESLAA
jgi:CBS domain-containing membrane protein